MKPFNHNFRGISLFCILIISIFAPTPSQSRLTTIPDSEPILRFSPSQVVHMESIVMSDSTLPEIDTEMLLRAHTSDFDLQGIKSSQSSFQAVF